MQAVPVLGHPLAAGLPDAGLLLQSVQGQRWMLLLLLEALQRSWQCELLQALLLILLQRLRGSAGQVLILALLARLQQAATGCYLLQRHDLLARAAKGCCLLLHQQQHRQWHPSLAGPRLFLGLCRSVSPLSAFGGLLA